MIPDRSRGQAPHISGDAPALFSLLPAMTGFATQTWHCWAAPERAADMLAKLTPYSHWCDTAELVDNKKAGGLSPAAALDTVRKGWQAGAAQAARLRDKISATRPRGPRLVKWDVAGAFPSVPRALAGDPLNMRRVDARKARRRPVLTLITHVGCSWSVDGAAMCNRAAAVAAIVDVIENAGYSVHVLAVSMAARDNQHLSGTVFQLKAPGEHCDIARLAFALGHAAMLRRLVFACRTSDKTNTPLGATMGSTRDFPASGDRAADTYELPSIGADESLFASEESTLRSGVDTLVAKLRAQGCPAFAETF